MVGENTAKSGEGSEKLSDFGGEWVAGDCAVGVSTEAEKAGTDDVTGGNSTA